MINNAYTALRSLLLGCALTTWVLLTGCDHPDSSKPQFLPDLNLHHLTGEMTPLREFKGRVAILHFWATWCPPCREEMPAIEAFSRELDTSRFALIAVSVDGDARLVDEYNRRYSITFARYIDKSGELSAQLRVPGFPATYIIGTDGKILHRMVGAQSWQDGEMQRLLDERYQSNGRAS